MIHRPSFAVLVQCVASHGIKPECAEVWIVSGPKDVDIIVDIPVDIFVSVYSCCLCA